ncbi:MAG: PAS domain S-box protein [Akkermansiaceae bacterium]|nr:PAS domain S-box protein [Akkermansiaceae bacterium]NNM27968.1 PAS domain S-box protein [Akkermansiaceae bacterium]
MSSPLDLPTSTSRHDDDDHGGLFENALGMICSAACNGRMQRLSPGWTATLGWPLEVLQGAALFDWVHPLDRDSTRLALDKLDGTSRSIVFENRFLCDDGHYKSLQWTANSRAGRRTFCAMVQDVSEARMLEQDVLDAHDSTLDRVGREIHDNLGPSLAGVTALASGLSTQLVLADRLESAAALEIRNLLRDTSRVARDLAHGLSPAAIDAVSLHAALTQLAANVGVFYGIHCAYHGELPTLGRNHHAGRHLLRVAQEAVTNAVHHGAPTGVEIALDRQADWGVLQIEDDGTGFPGTLPRHRGMGLRTMEYRARAIGGSLQLGSAAPHGGRVTCSFPLANEPPPTSP